MKLDTKKKSVEIKPEDITDVCWCYGCSGCSGCTLNCGSACGHSCEGCSGSNSW